MKATWDSDSGQVVLDGFHKPGKPRRWSVRLHVANQHAKECIVFKPKGKVLLTDIADIVSVHTDEFEKEHGTITKASWIATAR